MLSPAAPRTAEPPELDPADPAAVAMALIRCRSITPADGGAQPLLAELLAGLGFTVHPLRFGAVDNLYARIGATTPHLCFAGHTDVVPPGAASWTQDPFAASVRDGVLYGRGACDMKGGVAAFVAAAARHLATGHPHGSISLLITGDEEAEAVDGTVRVLEWMRQHGETPDFCLVGEPSNPTALGQMIKIGRRGSLNAALTVHGTQGHSAYPQRADNPVHRLITALSALTSHKLDAGTPRFEPSSLQVTSIDVGNPATNVIPAAATAKLNIRFNDAHTGASLTDWLHATIAPHAPSHTLNVQVSGEAFLTEPGPAVALLSRAIQSETGLTPALDTGGGTSDARFIAQLCPVAEFGLVGASMHKADECVRLDELETLTRIYTIFIGAFLNGTPA
jgi:succinyl-diaminopimelate desuccinylase